MSFGEGEVEGRCFICIQHVNMKVEAREGRRERGKEGEREGGREGGKEEERKRGQKRERGRGVRGWKERERGKEGRE